MEAKSRRTGAPRMSTSRCCKAFSQPGWVIGLKTPLYTIFLPLLHSDAERMHHFAAAKGETIVQVHAMGPFVLNYVNPADDPRKK